MLKRHSILWFTLLTLLLSYAVYFLPLPAEQRLLLVPVLMTFVPTLVSIPLAFLTEGRTGLRQLFQRVPTAGRWALVGAGIGVLIRVVALIVGLLLGTSIRVEWGGPMALFILLAPIPLAWLEELGWRRFALHRLLQSHSPWTSALLVGLPWSLLHLVILLPGMMNVGAPIIPQTLSLVFLSVILTWLYVRSGGSLLAVTLLHGVQNGLVVLNRGLGMAEATWLAMWVYMLFAAVMVLVDRRMFFAKPETVQSAPAQV